MRRSPAGRSRRCKLARKKQAKSPRKSGRAPAERGDVLDLKAAADFLKVSKPTFYRWLLSGIMRCGGAAGQIGAYQSAGTLTIGAGASVAQGQTYVVSGNAGKIAVESDLTTDDYVTILGVGNDADGIELDINVTGIAHV